MPGPDGKLMHAEIRIGDSIVMLNDEYPQMGAVSPQGLGGRASSLMIYTRDADALFKQALAAGAKVSMPLADMFWGDRYGRVVDPYGHDWRSPPTSRTSPRRRWPSAPPPRWPCLLPRPPRLPRRSRPSPSRPRRRIRRPPGTPGHPALSPLGGGVGVWAQRGTRGKDSRARSGSRRARPCIPWNTAVWLVGGTVPGQPSNGHGIVDGLPH